MNNVSDVLEAPYFSKKMLKFSRVFFDFCAKTAEILRFSGKNLASSYLAVLISGNTAKNLLEKV